MAENMRDMTLNLIVNSQVNKVKEFNKNLKDTENSIARTSNKIGWLGKTLKRFFGAYMGVNLIKDLVNTHRKLDLVRRSLNALTGSAQMGAKHFEFIKKAAFETGTEIESIAKAYRGYYYAAKTAGLADEELQHSFLGVMVGARVLGSGKMSVSGAMLALEQMLNKTTVQAEEMNRQLGNAISGAREMAAEAMGMSVAEFTEKMQKKQIQSAEFVKKFGDYMYKTFIKKLPEAMKSLDANIVNLKNAWLLFKMEIMDKGAGREITKIVRTLMQIIMSPKTRVAIIAIGKALNFVFTIIRYLVDNIKIIMYFMAPFMIGAALTRTVDILKKVVLWIDATNGSLATTQRLLLSLLVSLSAAKTIAEEIAGKGLIKEITTGEREEVDPETGEVKKYRVGKGGKVARSVALYGYTELVASVLARKPFALTRALGGGLSKIPMIGKLGTAIGSKLPKEGIWANIVKWAKQGEKAGEVAKEAKAIETVRESLILNKAGKPFILGKGITEVSNVAKASQMSKLGTFAKSFIPFASTGAMAAFFDYWLLGNLMHAGNKNVSKMGINPMSISPYGFAQPLGIRPPQAPSLEKTETIAPTINYNPQYNIDARGMSPEQLQQTLQRHDENFWSGFVQRTKGGFGYLKYLFGGGSGVKQQ